MISVIIPVYNDQRIIECIKSLQANSWPMDQLEIIIVDNHPIEEYRQLVEPLGVKYIHEPTAGSYAARNAGIQQASGDIIAFTDSDCQVNPDWLKTIAQVLEDTHTDGVMGLAQGHNRNQVATYEQQMYESNIQRFTGATALKRIDTRNVAIKKAVFDQVGLFNATLRYGGDMEYGARVHAAGYIIHFSKNMIVYHTNETNLVELARKRVKQNEGNMLILSIHSKRMIEDYFPHLLRYETTWLRSVQRASYSILLTLCLPLANLFCQLLPKKLGYAWFKGVNVLAMRLGQLRYWTQL